MARGFTIDDYRMPADSLMRCSKRQLRRIAERANFVAHSNCAVYEGLTHEETVIAAQYRRDDALYVLSLKGW